jgi:hypothetical protein
VKSPILSGLIGCVSEGAFNSALNSVERIGRDNNVEAL